jgi:alpha-galactosidase
MQHEASRWIAPEIQGSHVGPRTCHTSGRVLPMAFRAWVAAQRHMGFEMDPRELTAEEAATLTRVTAWFKANRDFLFSARHHRLDTQDAEVHAEMFASAIHDAPGELKTGLCCFMAKPAHQNRSRHAPIQACGIAVRGVL